eukprot:scaffold8621_cov87-Skeletonema_menzelii.AAC.1
MMAAKERFYELLNKKDGSKKRTKLLSEQEYDEICDVLNGWTVGAAHSRSQAKWYQNYILLENTSHSAALRWNKNNENLRVATKEQTFTIIMEDHNHIALAHAKDTRKIHARIATTWYGITREDVTSVLHLCPICMASQTKITAKQRPLKMILSGTVGSRGQMDLIDTYIVFFLGSVRPEKTSTEVGRTTSKVIEGDRSRSANRRKGRKRILMENKLWYVARYLPRYDTVFKKGMS